MTTLDELLNGEGMTVEYRLKHVNTVRKYWSKHNCYTYTRLYQLEGDVNVREAERILREVLQKKPGIRNLWFQHGPTERAIFAYWQADE